MDKQAVVYLINGILLIKKKKKKRKRLTGLYTSWINHKNLIPSKRNQAEKRVHDFIHVALKNRWT